MKHRPLEEFDQFARIAPIGAEDTGSLRRRRLERLASLLDEHKGPMRMFSFIEFVPYKERLTLRQERSPLAIAYGDLEFRRQGLAGDRIGDAVAFFELSAREAHALLCDCGYLAEIAPMRVTPGMVAERARTLARKTTLRELWSKLRAFVFGRAAG